MSRVQSILPPGYRKNVTQYRYQDTYFRPITLTNESAHSISPTSVLDYIHVPLGLRHASYGASFDSEYYVPQASCYGHSLSPYQVNVPKYNYYPRSVGYSPSPYPKHNITPIQLETKQEPPTPQNLKKDPQRLAKVKTELCEYYLTKKPCPFGDKCNYAHGEDELKYAKVMELEKAGLIPNAESYRTLPCWAHVATGSCPFGSRCSGIHDPNISSEHPSWLSHREVELTGLDAAANIDRFYYKIIRNTHQSNPLLYTKASWSDTYNQVCNLPFHSSCISELQRLKMVYSMLQSKPTMDYIYRPTHTIEDIPCMLLQTHNSQDISAYKLVFGPIDDPSVEQPSIWFNISLIPCTDTESKRLRRTKVTPFMIQPIKNSSIPPFYLAQPINTEASALLLDIYKHRMESLSGEEEHTHRLEYTFRNLKRGIGRFHVWPVQCEGIDETTTIPRCDQEYRKGSTLWKGFVDVLKNRDVNCKRLVIFKSLRCTSTDVPKISKSRLFILDPATMKEWDRIRNHYTEDSNRKNH